jgi:hypothetical protein
LACILVKRHQHILSFLYLQHLQVIHILNLTFPDSLMVIIA